MVKANTTTNSGEEVERLESIMEQLRGDNGCPWDRKQTHQSLRPYLLEEAYEVLQAIEEDQPGHVQEELGDLLFQVVFHAQIGKERGAFDLASVIRGVNEKMIRRHPHVFRSSISNKNPQVRPVNGVVDVLDNWEKIKAEERAGGFNGETGGQGAGEESILDSVPINLPALLQAEKLQRKATQVGFDWPDLKGPLSKVREELDEVRNAWEEWRNFLNKGSEASRGNQDPKIAAELQSKVEEEFGDLLFALVNTARFLGVHPEIALLRTIEKFRRRFRRMEQQAKAAGTELAALTLAEMDALWEQSKAEEEKKEDNDAGER
ncbi:MAG TPA: nucleoside triphosphate pyrophosphohydrolase [Firmicutes bacterium]|nr:nucleoside triphosphate pyrophosphohydrolase [Bacillota bacterium]